MRRFALSLALLLSPLLLSARTYSFNRIQVEDGLSQNMVYSICQDKLGFMWFGTQDGLNRYDGSRLKIFRKGGEGALGNDGVCALVVDTLGRLWVGTLDGLYVMDPRSETFLKVTLEDSQGNALDGIVRSLSLAPDGSVFASVQDRFLLKVSLSLEAETVPCSLPSSDTRIRSIWVDSIGNVWAATWLSSLLRIRPDGDIETFPCLQSEMLTKVVPLGSEKLLVGTTDVGVLVFDIRTKEFSPLPLLYGPKVGFVHDITIDSSLRVWVGTESGLFIKDGNTLSHERHVPGDSYSLSDNAVYCITEDSFADMWIGTYFGGVNHYAQYFSQFSKYFPISLYNGLEGKNIGEFLEREDGRIYVGTEDGGLYLFDPQQSSFKRVEVPATNIHALSRIDGLLWVGTYGRGLYLYDEKRRTCRHLDLVPDGGSIRDESVYAIFRDSDGSVYLGTEGGLWQRKPKGKSFHRVAQELIKSQVNDIHQDINGYIWLATSTQGIFVRNPRSGKWESLPSPMNYATCILEDSDHNLWFGTEDSGLYCLDRANLRFDCNFTTADGLPDNMIYKLLEDGSENIWGSTNHGLFMLSPKDRQVAVYDHNAGIGGDQFNYKSGLRSSDGALYFGGVSGFVSFYPERLVYPSSSSSSLVFSEFLIGGKPVDLTAKDSPLECSVAYADHIVLHPNQKVFSVGFSDLNFPASKVRRYRYRLLGLDQTWIDCSVSSLITVSDLKSGSYRLEVNCFPSPNEPNSPSSIFLSIRVLPPWYRSPWAYVFYAAAFLTLLYFGVRAIMQRSKRRNEAVLSEMERRKEKEMYDSQIGFFTHVTHEIKTPLTLISAPLSDVMQQVDPSSPFYEDLSIVQRNCDRLLSLVNELLDFRKAGVDTMLPNFVHTDVAALTTSVVADFRVLAKSRSISFELNLPPTLLADVDTAVYCRILNNILTNACKFASSTISLSLESSNGQFTLSVSNDGPLIPPGQEEKIFDPFVKLDENVPGSGIGLSFARNLAATHGGRIYLDRTRDKTCFVVQLPLVQEGTFLQSRSEVDNAEEDGDGVFEKGSDKKYTILVVDDNEDFCNFLSRKFSDDYRVITSRDGNEAVKLLSKESVDLIVTDLMMPGLDGLSLCSYVKGDLRSSHIPVIVITAKADDATRLECLKEGADDFIAKPFQMPYLRVKVENLLKSRERIRHTFGSSPEVDPSLFASNSNDAEFIAKLKGIIDENLDNPELSVDVIADAFSMSRATFYRKMKGLTSVSPNEFIKICRLKKGAALLSQKKYSVAEVAYMVGFNSPSYFSHCFSAQFGVSPKDYAA